jgi:hypothetical protein
VTVIYSPEEGYTGPGPAGLHFENGRAETDNAMVVRYARKAGYGIDEEASAQDAPEQPDARDFAEAEQIGTRLRDAAVDPRPSDFLPPTNAGEADPHGPLVVAPGIHAAETGPIHPGDVHVDEPELQEAQETALAEAVFVRGEDVTEATRAAATAEVDRPAQSATKGDWVDYAVSVGELSREDAEAMTKAQLIETYGTDTSAGTADDTNKEA